MACLVGMAGFEPAECGSQNPVPYHLATSQYGAGRPAQRLKIAVKGKQFLNMASLLTSFQEKPDVFEKPPHTTIS